MQLVLYMYQALCKPSVFEINGRQADYEDFGVQIDINPDPQNPYGCGNMTFTRYTVPLLGVKEKYNITDEEYNEVCNALEEKLSWGSCGWCE